jgi:hypothetical protein
MHPYIPHLLNDILKAHRAEINIFEQPVPKTFEEEMEEIERWCEGEEPEHTFSYHCGLQPENFPPPEQLTVKDIKLVNKAFEAMMFTWNITIDLPKKMPPKVAYTFIVDCLNEKVDIVNTGFTGFDFCTGYAPNCKLKEYCPCLEIWNSLPDENMNDAAANNGDDLPF